MRSLNSQHSTLFPAPSNFKRILQRAVFLPLSLMMALMVLFLWQIDRLIAASQWVEHTDAVIAQAVRTQKLLIDMETGMRGYLITGRQEFLEPYNQASQKADPALNRLGRLIADNPPQLRRLNHTRFQYGQWAEFSRDMIELKRRGGDYQARVISSEGKAQMDVIRAQFTAFIGTEEMLRDERTRTTRQVAQQTIISGLTMALVLGLILASFIKSQLMSVSHSYSQALAAEQEHQQWLATTLTSIGDAVIATDGAGQVIFMNPVAESLTGWKREAAEGRFLPEIFSLLNEETRNVVESPVAKVLQDGKVVGLANHTILVTRDGREIPIDDSGAPIKDEEGRITGVVLVFHDITIRKRAEQERERLLQKAEESNRLKDEFLATLSHELRTPMTSIIGWLPLLRSGRLDQTQSAQALEAIERNATIQHRLIEDLLDSARITTAKLALDMQSVDMALVIKDAVETIRPAAAAKNIQVETNIDTKAGRVLGDPLRLQQALWNLLSNAMKFTPAGGQITVSLRRVESQIEVSVSDTGQGINPEFLPYVFDRFRQADGGATRRHGGLGLGLALVHHLVELHGGTTRAWSEGPDRGAVFTLCLPLHASVGSTSSGSGPAGSTPLPTEIIEQPAATHERPVFACPPTLEGLRVLVVDDYPDARQVLDVALSQCGAEVISVASAAEALQEIQRQRPDVLISDIGMPDEDGYELIKKLRRLEVGQGREPLPALALTAYAKTDDQEHALAVGYHAHQPKPINPADVLLVVADLAQGLSPARNET